MSFTASQRREIEAIVASLAANKRGLISGYQTTPPMVKVQIMPPPPDATAVETGWIPYLSAATGVGGGGWRIVTAPQIGQQVLLICEEANGQNYIAWGGYFSDVDPAPEGAQPGELLLQHQTGAQLHLGQDGTISLLTDVLKIAGPGGGNAEVIITGSLTASVEVSAKGKAFTPHTHPYAPGSGALTQTGAPEN